MTTASTPNTDPTHPELRAELLARAECDQQARRANDATAMKEVDAENLAFLAPLLDQHGWLDAQMVGDDGALREAISAGLGTG